VRREGDRIKMDAQFMQIVNTAAPFLRQLDSILYSATAIIPGLEETIEEMSTVEDKYDKLNQGLQLLSYYTGIKAYALDVDEAKKSKARGRYYEAKNRRTDARSIQPGAELRRDANRERTDDLVRRLQDALR
jgi:hypothetical protein